MENRCWSTLPFDLLRRVAGCFLDTADLDYYMDFRAVCRNWRAATANPRNTLDSRFRPRHWIMVHYRYNGGDNPILVNTATGRFHGKDLPLLRNYYVISVTDDGLLVLAERALPHAARVLNPFTGYMVRFAAPIRPYVLSTAVSSSRSSPPSLVLYCRHDSRNLYIASPESECFVRYRSKYTNSLVRKAVVGGVSMEGDEGVLPPLPAAVVAKIFDLINPFNIELYLQVSFVKRCFIVKSAGERLVLFKLQDSMEVYKIDMDGNTLEPVKSIGSRAIFLSGFNLGISVDADKFPSIEANCIYYIDSLMSPYVDMYHLKDEGPIVKASSTDLPIWRDSLVAHPTTVIQILILYTLNIPCFKASRELFKEQNFI